MTQSTGTSQPNYNSSPHPHGQSLLPVGWPVIFTLWTYPILWLVGVSNFVLLLFAPVMLAHLWSYRAVRLPGGTGIWLVFLLWVPLSAAQISLGAGSVVWAFRFAVYLTAGICLVYAFNLPRDRFPSEHMATGLTFLWVWTVGGGLAAILFGNVELTSLLEMQLPSGLQNEGFVQELVHPAIAQLHDFLGFPVARPAAPFAYTNAWGSHLALLTPFVFIAARRSRGWQRLLLATGGFAIVPIVQSLNRGLWLSLAVGAIYTAIVYALRGRVRPLMTLAAGAAILVFALLVTPLGGLVGARLDAGHSDNRRLDLYSNSVELALQSPLVGHGAPVPDPEQLERAPVGTHGQLWTVLVSHGIPATILFLAFLLVLLWKTGSASIGTFEFATHVALVILCVQVPIYSLTPTQLPLLCLAAGIALREMALRRDSAPVAVPTGPNVP